MTIITLAIAVSFDSATVGLIYGMRGIRLKLLPLSLIMLQSAIVVTVAMTAGSFFKKFISPDGAEALGSFVLILLGAWMLTALILNGQGKKTKIRSQDTRHSPTSILRTP